MAWGDFYSKDPSVAANRAQDWGALFNQAKSDWEARPLDDRLKERGFTMGSGGENGPQWSAPENSPYAVSYSGDNTADYQKMLDAGGAFDPRSFVDKYRVLPLDSADYNGNTAYNDQSIAAQNKGNLNQFLNYVSGGSGGQIVNDPKMGRVFVPNDPGSFDPYRDFSPKRGGNFIDKIVMGTADSGGLVTALAGGVISMSGVVGDLMNAFKGGGDFTPGTFDGPGGVQVGDLSAKGLGTGVGTASAGAGVGPGNLLQAAKTAATILSPLSSVFAAKQATDAAQKMGQGGSINGTPTTTATTPPTVTPPVTMPTYGPGGSLLLPMSTPSVQRASIQDQSLRRGRASTFLTADQEKLGA